MRFGGEVRSGDRDRSQWEARAFFFARVAVLIPELVETLRDELLPAVQKLMVDTTPSPTRRSARTPFGSATTTTDRPDWLYWSWANGEWDNPGDDQLVTLAESVVNVARNFHLYDEWQWDVLLKTLRHWTLSSEPSWEFAKPHFFDVSDDPALRFEFAPWTPEWQSWSDYSDQALDSFESALARYHQNVMDQSRDSLDPGVEMRGRRNSDSLHMDWLVRFQIAGETLNQIATRPGDGRKALSPQTISVACRNTSKLLGLTRRTKRGSK